MLVDNKIEVMYVETKEFRKLKKKYPTGVYGVTKDGYFRTFRMEIECVVTIVWYNVKMDCGING